MGPESTAFMTCRDTDDVVVTGPLLGEGIPGVLLRPVFATERQHSVRVVGATRSGKTADYTISALLLARPGDSAVVEIYLLQATVPGDAPAWSSTLVRPPSTRLHI